MTTPQELKAEIQQLRQQLAQERQDHAAYVKQLKATALEEATQRVIQVLLQLHDCRALMSHPAVIINEQRYSGPEFGPLTKELMGRNTK